MADFSIDSEFPSKLDRMKDLVEGEVRPREYIGYDFDAACDHRDIPLRQIIQHPQAEVKEPGPRAPRLPAHLRDNGFGAAKPKPVPRHNQPRQGSYLPSETAFDKKAWAQRKLAPIQDNLAVPFEQARASVEAVLPIEKYSLLHSQATFCGASRTDLRTGKGMT